MLCFFFFYSNICFSNMSSFSLVVFIVHTYMQNRYIIILIYDDFFQFWFALHSIMRILQQIWEPNHRERPVFLNLISFFLNLRIFCYVKVASMYKLSSLLLIFSNIFKSFFYSIFPLKNFDFRN